MAVHEYQQAFLVGSAQRLCLTCSKVMADAPPQDTVLRSVSGLFCSAACEDKHWLKVRARAGMGGEEAQPHLAAVCISLYSTEKLKPSMLDGSGPIHVLV